MPRSSTERLGRCASAAVVAVLSFAPAMARAQSEADAEALIQRGLQERKDQRDAEALEDFSRAYQRTPSPRTLAHIGLAEQALGRWSEAEQHLDAALQSERDPWIARHHATLEESLESVRGRLAIIEVVSNVDAGTVWFNGTSLGQLPLLAKRVAAGPASIEVRGEGFETVVRSMTLEARRSYQITLLVTPHATDPPPPALVHRSDPQPPLPRLAVASDAASIQSVRRTLAWALLVSGGLLVVAGVVANVVHQTSITVYNDDSRCLFGDLSRSQRCGSYLGEAQAADVVAIAAYASAGLALGASSYCFITSSPPAPSRTSVGRWVPGLGVAYGISF